MGHRIAQLSGARSLARYRRLAAADGARSIVSMLPRESFSFWEPSLYAQRQLWSIPAAVAGGVLVFWAGAVALRWFNFPLILPAAAIFLAVAYVFWQESRRQETLADWLLAISFVVWAAVGVHFLFFPRRSVLP